jgi:carboxymethylenebutenolidase
LSKEIIALCDDYNEGTMTRRVFIDRLALLAGGSAAALALLPLLEADYSQAPIVPEDHGNLAIDRIEYDADGTKIAGYLARVKGGEKRPGVVVIHENRGLNPHIEDVARRFALDGFLALAPDMLSPFGGTAANQEEATKLLGTLKPDDTVARLAAAVRFVASHSESTGKVGVVGYCWGGALVNQLVAAGTPLAAGVSYYGRQLPAAQVPRISAPLMLHYGELDERINAGIAEFEAALKSNNKPYELYMYEAAHHAFNNNTNASRYHKEAAELAWSRTIAFFRKHLGT